MLSAHPNDPPRLPQRLSGIFFRPRATMRAAVSSRAWAGVWLLGLIVWAACGTALLSTAVGQQALVDERVRVVEGFGGDVTDAQYAAWQARPPVAVYLTSGARWWLLPPVTLAVAAGLVGLARRAGAPAPFAAALAVVTHANVVLVAQQVAMTPLHYLRESLTGVSNVAALLPMVEEGSAPALWLGAIDLVGVWWLWLLATGVGVMTGRPARASFGWLLAAYAAIAAVGAVVVGLSGGS